MSQRYLGGWIQDGLFNPLAAPPGTPTYTYELWSWGLNTYGQLGLGNLTNRSSPVQVGALTTWLTIAGGAYHTIATKTDGTLYSWGQTNNYGQLGLGNLTNYSSPKQVGTLTTWSKVSAGWYHTLATKTDGTLWSWGYNAQGQLGLGNTTNYSSPKQVGALTTWLNITAGRNHTLATKTDGTLWSWGSGATYGQLGLGNTTYYSSPKQVGALTTWLNITAGRDHTIATKTDGTLWAWGSNYYGQLGLGSTANYSSPVQVGALTTWSKVSAGWYHTLATKTDGTLWSWGPSTTGQLGLGNTTSYSSPKQVGLLTTWSKIAGGAVFSLATKTDGTLWSWGYNLDGQLGLGTSGTGTYKSSPNQVGALTTWSSPSCGGYHTLALKY